MGIFKAFEKIRKRDFAIPQFQNEDMTYVSELNRYFSKKYEDILNIIHRKDENCLSSSYKVDDNHLIMLHTLFDKTINDKSVYFVNMKNNDLVNIGINSLHQDIKRNSLKCTKFAEIENVQYAKLLNILILMNNAQCDLSNFNLSNIKLTGDMSGFNVGNADMSDIVIDINNNNSAMSTEYNKFALVFDELFKVDADKKLSSKELVKTLASAMIPKLFIDCDKVANKLDIESIMTIESFNYYMACDIPNVICKKITCAAADIGLVSKSGMKSLNEELLKELRIPMAERGMVPKSNIELMCLDSRGLKISLREEPSLEL